MNSFYKSIIDCIQQEVDKINNDKYGDDDCQPMFLVSVIGEGEGDGELDKIILTITHLRQSFSNVIFPRKDSWYGYEELGHIMRDMYNRTM